MSSTIVAEAATCTLVAGISARDYHLNLRLALAIAVSFGICLFLASKESLTLAQLGALPCLCAISYTDAQYRSVSVFTIIALSIFTLIAGATGVIAWLATGVLLAAALHFIEPFTPKADLVTVASIVALFHSIGAVAVMIAIAMCLAFTVNRGSTLPTIARMERSKWPLAGIVAAACLVGNLAVTIGIPAPFASPDALRMIGLP